MLNRCRLCLLLVVASTIGAESAAAQGARADSLEQWIRRAYTTGSPDARQIWRELGWNGVGFGFRTFAAREAASDDNAARAMNLFATATEYYRITLNEVQTRVDGDIGLAWGVHTEAFKVKGQEPESVRVRFTNTLRWNGKSWTNLLYHRDAQPFNENGRYVKPSR